MLNNNFSGSSIKSSVKFTYYREIKNNQQSINNNFFVNLFGNKSKNKRIFNFNKNTIQQKNINPILNLKPTYNTKIIALLNLNDATYDVPIKNTLEYYFNNVPGFYKFPIINTEGNKQYIISLLDKYYSEGYRYFYGFTISPELNYVLEWFNSHPDSQGISNQSLSSSLAIPKKIFRILNSKITSIQFKQMVKNCDAVYFVYNNNNVTFLGWNNLLSNICNEENISFNSYTISNTNDISNKINIIINDINQDINNNQYINIAILNSTAEWQDLYFNSFYGAKRINNTLFYTITNSLPKITDSESKIYFNNKLKIILNTANLNSSPLWRQGLNNLNDNFNYSTLNAMNILYKLDKKGGYINEIGNYSDSQIFDLVTRDNLSNSWSVKLYLNETYTTINIYNINHQDELYEAILTL